MHARLLAFSLAPLFVGSLAHAQAPGELVPQPPPPAAPAPEGACPAPCGGCSPAAPHTASVMDNRWAIGLSLGQMGLAPDGQPDNQTAFGVGELALRFRATPHLELELAAGGGREQLPDDQQGDLEVNTAMIAARYRFRPEAAWNWFVMGGLGGASITRHDATKQERDNATQPLGMLGVGVERRFRHFALQAEARAVGLGEQKNTGDTMVVTPPEVPAGAMATTSTPPVSPIQKQSGGSLSIGLSYYF